MSTNCLYSSTSSLVFKVLGRWDGVSILQNSLSCLYSCSCLDHVICCTTPYSCVLKLVIYDSDCMLGLVVSSHRIHLGLIVRWKRYRRTVYNHKITKCNHNGVVVSHEIQSWAEYGQLCAVLLRLDFSESR